MKRQAGPFRVPAALPPDLVRVEGYWRGLLRGDASVPFSDDLDLQALTDLRPRLFVIDVFAMPERFRFAIVGDEVSSATGQKLTGRFADEVEPHYPLDYLRAQASATVEGGAPSFYRHEAVKPSNRGGYSRLLLPLWQDGHINMLLGMVQGSTAASS